MKKLVLSIAMCFVLFVSGLALTGCFGGKSSFEISIENNATPVRVVVISNDHQLLGQTVENNKQKYVVDKFSNVTVEIRCDEEGYDLSGLSFEVNGTAQTLSKKEKNFDVKNGHTLYASFLIGRIKDDYDIVLSGVKGISTKFNVKKVYNEATDSATNQKLNLTQICFENEDGKQYVNLGTYLASAGEKSFTHDFDREESDPILSKYRSFRIKFVGGDILQVPEGELNVDNSPFVLQAADGSKVSVASFKQNYEYVSESDAGSMYYVVDMGEQISQQQEWTLLVDFSKIEYKQFDVIAPEENLVFEVTGLPKSVIYTDKLHFTVKKTNSSCATYDNMEVYINSKKLTQQSTTADSVTFDVQAKTPDDWNAPGYDQFSSFVIFVKGIELQDPHKLTASVVTGEGESQGTCFVPYFKTVSSGGELKGVLAKDDEGNTLTNEQLTNAIVWEYPYRSDINAYQMAYDIYDYYVLIQEGATPQSELFNLGDLLQEKTENFTTNEDVSATLSDGRVFKATFNRGTATYDKFRIEFVATDDVEFVFNQLKRYTKYVKLDYDVPNNVLSAYTSVQYALLDADADNDDNLQYSAFTNGRPVVVQVKEGDVIYFKFSILSSIFPEDFELFNQLISDGPSIEASGNTVVVSLRVGAYQYGKTEEDAQELTLKYIGMGLG